MPGAFKPVEDVGAPGVVDLVEWVSVGLLHGHGVAKRRESTQVEVSTPRRLARQTNRRRKSLV